MNLQEIYSIASCLEYIKTQYLTFTLIDIPYALFDDEELKGFNLQASQLIKKIKENMVILITLINKHNISEKIRKEMELELKKIKEIYDNKKSIKEKTKDTIKFYENLIVKVRVWEDRIYEEIGEMIISKPYLDGNLNYNKLIKGVEYFFDIETWENLQDIEKRDLQDFRTCYLHKAWTPAGFIAMRTIESAVRKYYKDLTGQDKNKWWKITDELLKHPKANQDLVKKLDYIRVHVRNPLAHPEIRITIQESEEIFQQALQVLTKVYG